MRLPQWPWVSRKRWESLVDWHQELKAASIDRSAYDTVCDERDRLQAQNDKLLDHVSRMDRLEHGVGETAKQPRADLLPMPVELREHIEGWDNPSVRKNMRDTTLRRHAGGEPWGSIMDDVIPEEERDVEIPSP